MNTYFYNYCTQEYKNISGKNSYLFFFLIYFEKKRKNVLMCQHIKKKKKICKSNENKIVFSYTFAYTRHCLQKCFIFIFEKKKLRTFNFNNGQIGKIKSIL